MIIMRVSVTSIRHFRKEKEKETGKNFGGNVTMDRENKLANSWSALPLTDPKNNCGTYFGSTSLHVSKVANDPSMLRALGEQVTSMSRARRDRITSTMQACHSHKHSASILQAQCEKITSVVRACNEHEASMLPSWHKNTNTMRTCYERANKGDARRNCLNLQNTSCVRKPQVISGRRGMRTPITFP